MAIENVNVDVSKFFDDFTKSVAATTSKVSSYINETIENLAEKAKEQGEEMQIKMEALFSEDKKEAKNKTSTTKESSISASATKTMEKTNANLVDNFSSTNPWTFETENNTRTFQWTAGTIINGIGAIASGILNLLDDLGDTASYGIGMMTTYLITFPTDVIMSCVAAFKGWDAFKNAWKNGMTATMWKSILMPAIDYDWGDKVTDKMFDTKLFKWANEHALSFMHRATGPDDKNGWGFTIIDKAAYYAGEILLGIVTGGASEAAGAVTVAQSLIMGSATFGDKIEELFGKRKNDDAVEGMSGFEEVSFIDFLKDSGYSFVKGSIDAVIFFFAKKLPKLFEESGSAICSKISTILEKLHVKNAVEVVKKTIEIGVKSLKPVASNLFDEITGTKDHTAEDYLTGVVAVILSEVGAVKFNDFLNKISGSGSASGAFAAFIDKIKQIVKKQEGGNLEDFDDAKETSNTTSIIQETVKKVKEIFSKSYDKFVEKAIKEFIKKIEDVKEWIKKSWEGKELVESKD